MAAIEIIDNEELFLLKSMKETLDILEKNVPLYLVGDWTRAKFFQKVSYHYELLCHKENFDLLKNKLIQVFNDKQILNVFNEVAFPTNGSKFKREKNKSMVIRLFTKNGNKYKVSLNILFNNSLLDDLISRDFTINALYCDLNKKVLVEYNDAFDDFHNKTMRTIRSPNDTFENQINLFFRFIEFVVRYDLTICDDIVQYFSHNKNGRSIFLKAHECQHNNLYSSTKKFFSKHYVSEMLKLMVSINVIDFFILNFKNPMTFVDIFEKVIDLVARLETCLLKEFKDLMKKEYPLGIPKVFFTKARLLLISLVFCFYDPLYAHEFLRVFFYNNKNVSGECFDLHMKLCEIISNENEFTTEVYHQLVQNQAIELIGQNTFDKSKWALIFAVKVIWDYHEEGFSLID